MPGTLFSVPFSVTTGGAGGNFTIRATNNQQSFNSVSPTSLILVSGNSTDGTVNITAPLNTPSGTDFSLTIEAEAPGGADTNYVMLRFSVLNTVILQLKIRVNVNTLCYFSLKKWKHICLWTFQSPQCFTVLQPPSRAMMTQHITLTSFIWQLDLLLFVWCQMIVMMMLVLPALSSHRWEDRQQIHFTWKGCSFIAMSSIPVKRRIVSENVVNLFKEHRPYNSSGLAACFHLRPEWLINVQWKQRDSCFTVSLIKCGVTFTTLTCLSTYFSLFSRHEIYFLSQ